MVNNELITHTEPTVLLFGKYWMKAEDEIKQNEMEPHFRSQYEHKMLTYPCPIPCLGKSALCIQSSCWDHTMLHVSLSQSLFSFSFSDSRYTLYDPVSQSFQSYAIWEGHRNATASSSNMLIHCHGI